MKRLAIVGLIFLILIPEVSSAQQFGQNKIQYERFNWQILQSAHFDIYFYQGGQRLAEFVADEAESSYVKLSRDINYELVDRISIVLYNSHADFEETNISPQVIPTSVGGFTEFFKNRVVIPFEGDYEKFRHVLHHELTHAVSLQFFFGAGPGAILKGISRLNLPLWFVEGMAEYMSLRWDTESDMFVRDAAISGYLPPIPQLSAYMAYKGGQSLYYYIAKTYGDKKISEMLWSVRNRRSVERGIKEALRIDLTELSQQWQAAMRKQYWPDIKNRQTPAEIAIQLTDNRKWLNFVNNSPAISPSGDKIAFLSDKSGYFDIYLMSTLDGKIIDRLVKGQRKSDLEDLNWLTPGMSWSSDGKYLVFAAKSGPEDALNIIDVEQREIVQSLKFGLDAIFSPDWNPAKNQIAFSGMKEAGTDIYIYDMDTRQLQQITNDVFSDLAPSWSPDGRYLAFQSDRGDYLTASEIPEDFKMQQYDYHQTDIYVIDLVANQIVRQTATPVTKEISPEFTPDGQLAFISDENGIFNIFVQDLNSKTARPLTNLLTGCAQLSWSKTGDRLAFTAFAKGGYNIYLWINPLEKIDEVPSLENTVYLNDLQEGILVGEMDFADSTDQKGLRDKMKSRQDFRRFVFDSDFSDARINQPEQRAKAIVLSEDDVKDESGDYVSKKYKLKFSIDYAGGYMGYDPFWGLQGLSQIIFSDMMGDHQIGLGINLIQSIQNSDFQLVYSYLPLRTDFTASAYHFVNFFQSYDPFSPFYYTLIRFRTYGAGLQMNYPLNRFFRLTAGLNSLNVTQDYLDYEFIPSSSIHTLIPSLGLTRDNTIWGFFGPSAGSRWNISVGVSPSLWKSSLDFQTITADYRRYFAFGREFSLSMRATGGISFGLEPQRFILGGLPNWINYKFKDNIPITKIEDLFFSSFITPLRGSNYYEQYGSRFFLTNFEFKFPLIDYLILRFPLPINFSYIRGAGFLDAGSAWEVDKEYRAFKKNESGRIVTDDLILGFGYGIRIYLGFALLRIDSAWRTDLKSFSEPIFYFSLGSDF